MTEDWTITFGRFEYGPIPQSWLDHPCAEDRGGQEWPRLFAVSTAPYGRRTLKVRYGEPRTGNVLILQLPADELDSGGIVPESLLTGAGWSRSLYPPAGAELGDSYAAALALEEEATLVAGADPEFGNLSEEITLHRIRADPV